MKAGEVVITGKRSIIADQLQLYHSQHSHLSFQPLIPNINHCAARPEETKAPLPWTRYPRSRPCKALNGSYGRTDKVERSSPVDYRMSNQHHRLHPLSGEIY